MILEGDLVSYEANNNKIIEMYKSGDEGDIAALETLMELTFPQRRIDVENSAMENGVIAFIDKTCPVLRKSSYVGEFFIVQILPNQNSFFYLFI